MRAPGYVLLFSVFCSLIGCAVLQESPPSEISVSRLSCEKNPAIVDGDLETIAVFAASGTVLKGFERRGSLQRQYRRKVVGDMKPEILIKLDAPIYIDYIDLYPGSRIPRLTLDTTAEEISPKWGLSFEAVEDKRGKDIEGTRPVRFWIRREVLYLRLNAYALEDSENVGVYSEAATRKMVDSLKAMNASPEVTDELRQRWEAQRREGEMQIPLKGAAIREVKFYGRP